MGTGISFSGVGSGLPIQDWISQLVSARRLPLDNLYAKKNKLGNVKTILSTVESDFRAFSSSVQKLTDANLASSFDIFSARNATSSDTDAVTVTASNNTALQSLTLVIESLATSTKAQNDTFAQTVEGTNLFTDIANKHGEEGTLSIYANGIKTEITIEETDTLDDIAGKINTAFGSDITASVIDGKFDITYDNIAVTELTLGSSADTSNFFDVMQLSTASATDNGNNTSTLESTSEISKINMSGTITNNGANLNITGDPITEGTFTIGTAEFTVNASTTLAGLISQINRDEDSGVKAQIDTKNNTLVLISNDAGKTAINLENGTSNFLTKIGLITDTGDSLSSQILGNNAVVYLNGSETALEVNSNTITGAVSGITGLTITLKNTTEEEETVEININQDTEEIKESLETFISKYNKIISDVAFYTSKDQNLHREYSLINIKNSVRSMTTDRISSLSDYDSLAMIGISTGSIGKSVEDTSNSLHLDSDKLLEALQKNPSEVKALLIGDADAGITGIFQNLEAKLDNVLDPVNGYFEVREDSVNTTIKTTDKSIARGEERLESYRKLITKQFSDMDQYIAQMQQQSQTLAGL